jgi:hypothetical protein
MNAIRIRDVAFQVTPELAASLRATGAADAVLQALLANTRR